MSMQRRKTFYPKRGPVTRLRWCKRTGENFINALFMTSSLLWKHVTYEQVNELMSTFEPDRVKSLLAEYLGLHRPVPPAAAQAHEPSSPAVGAVTPIVTEEEVLLEFHFHNFAFAKQRRFSQAQTSTLMGILKVIIDEDMKKPAIGNNMRKSFERFESLLLLHSVERPPVSAGIFSVDEAAAITEYALNGYYRHFKLYEYIFKGRVLMTLRQTAISGVQDVKLPKPLNQGVLVQQPDVAAAST